MQLFYYCTAFI